MPGVPAALDPACPAPESASLLAARMGVGPRATRGTCGPTAGQRTWLIHDEPVGMERMAGMAGELGPQSRGLAGIRTVLCNVRTPRMNAIARTPDRGMPPRAPKDRTLVCNQAHLRQILRDSRRARIPGAGRPAGPLGCGQSSTDCLGNRPRPPSSGGQLVRQPRRLPVLSRTTSRCSGWTYGPSGDQVITLAMLLGGLRAAGR